MKNSWLVYPCIILGACATTRGPEDLLGEDLGAVRARLGPPISASAGGGVWKLAYRSAAGTVIEDAVVTIGGVVVRAAPDARPNQAVGAPAWTAATVADLVAVQGEARVDAVGVSGVDITCGGMQFTVVDGRIAGTR